jgi:cyanate lyase
MMPSPAVAKLSSAAFIGIVRSLHCERGGCQPLRLLPSSQHPLLPLPIEVADTSNSHVPLAPSEIQATFLESGITKVAFIRHGNTAPASNDFERTLTELGRSQSLAAGASYGIDLYPFFNEALCSSAPRCVETAIKLQEALPNASKQDIEAMKTSFPMRAFDEAILKEPNVYRTYEAITHYGEAIKSIINEQCGDGIMSAIDFYCDVGTTTGKHGEKRVVITFNGKFLPHIEQKMDDNSAKSPRD